MSLSDAYCQGVRADGTPCGRKVPRVGRLAIYRYCWQHRQQGAGQ